MQKEIAMLLLTRRPGESIIIKLPTDEHIEVTVLGIKGNQVKIGTDAPWNKQEGGGYLKAAGVCLYMVPYTSHTTDNIWNCYAKTNKIQVEHYGKTYEV